MVKTFTGDMGTLIILLLFCWPAGLWYYFGHRQETYPQYGYMMGGSYAMPAMVGCRWCGAAIPYGAPGCQTCGRSQY